MIGGGFHRLLYERNMKFDGTCPEATGAIVPATGDYLTQRHGGGDCQRRQSSFKPVKDVAITAAMEIIATAASYAI
jgi:hypothetical protein